MSPTLEQLSMKFPIPGLRFQTGHGGLTKAVIETSVSRGEIYLHGAHVTRFEPQGQSPVLWMSEQSLFESGKPIRGGVPVCFPWFGPHLTDPKALSHGLARTKSWSVLSADALGGDGITVTLQTVIDDFRLAYQVTFGTALKMLLKVSLSDQATEAATFEEALHTYLAVSDVRNVVVEGLDSAEYIDKVDGAKLKPASGKPLRFSGECDCVYLNTVTTCTLRDAGLERVIKVSKTNSQSTVVWNPWIDKSSRMADFGDKEWPGMVCIETANVASNAIPLNPGQSHMMTAKITAASSR